MHAELQHMTCAHTSACSFYYKTKVNKISHQYEGKHSRSTPRAQNKRKKQSERKNLDIRLVDTMYCYTRSLLLVALSFSPLYVALDKRVC